MATTVTAIAAVAIHPSPLRRGPITFAPMMSAREASNIITAMIGTAITPLTTADQNNSLTGSVGVKHKITPPTVAAPITP